MIIIEMDSDSQAFHALEAATMNPSIYKLRIALDEGQFKIKLNEDTWTAELAGATIKANGTTVQFLRDMGFPRAAELLEAEDTDPFTDVQKFERFEQDRRPQIEWTHDGVTARVGRYRDWRIVESKLDGWVLVSNDRDAHEGTKLPNLEVALRAIDAEAQHA